MRGLYFMTLRKSPLNGAFHDGCFFATPFARPQKRARCDENSNYSAQVGCKFARCAHDRRAPRRGTQSTAMKRLLQSCCDVRCYYSMVRNETARIILSKKIRLSKRSRHGGENYCRILSSSSSTAGFHTCLSNNFPGQNLDFVIYYVSII